MPLVTCPKCKNKVSDLAVNCKFCKFHLRKNVPPTIPTTTEKKGSGCGTAFFVVVGIIVVAIFGLSNYKASSNGSDSASSGAVADTPNIQQNSTHNTPSKIGLSASDSCHALDSIGIEIDPYKKDEDAALYGEEYDHYCLSPYKELDGDGSASFKSNVAYYVYGVGDSIKKYEFTANINDLSSEQEAIKKLTQATKILIPKVTGVEPSEKILNAIRKHKHYKKKINQYTVSIDKGHLTKGYSITLNIKRS